LREGAKPLFSGCVTGPSFTGVWLDQPSERLQEALEVTTSGASNVQHPVHKVKSGRLVPAPTSRRIRGP
jgi:hypothetical protein